MKFKICLEILRRCFNVDYRLLKEVKREGRGKNMKEKTIFLILSNNNLVIMISYFNKISNDKTILKSKTHLKILIVF